MSRIEYYRPSLEDAEGMLELERLSFSAPWSLAELKSILFTDPIVFTLGAFVEKEIVGYISATFSEPGMLHILSICIHPEHRRAGVATNFLDYAIHWGRHLKADRVALEVRESNTTAQSFYANNGFVEVEILPDYYPNEDGVKMQRQLIPFTHSISTSLYLANKLHTIPKIGVVLGSGLGWVTETFGIGQSIPFANIPGMAGEAVKGHSHKLQTSSDGKILFVMGRRHHYQGYSGREITLLPSALAAIGVGSWVLTSSAGSVVPEYSVGDSMQFTDHINFSGVSPDTPGNFIGSSVYSPSLMKISDSFLKNSHKGVFACVSGPTYETEAEVKMIRESGANAVSMSTAPEALALKSMGSRVLALALITNAVESGESVCHEEVLSAQETVKQKQENSLVNLLIGLVDEL